MLNLKDYIHLGVQREIKNLDYVIAQYVQPTGQRCGNSVAFNAAISDLMGTASAIWDEGSDDAARAKSYCRNEEKTAFISSFNRFLAFDGTVLDQALPRTAGDDSNERNAIVNLLQEMKFLAGNQQKPEDQSNQRRDRLLRSLIRVLAFDYDAAVQQMRDLQAKSGFRLATAAPGGPLSDGDIGTIGVGSTETIHNSMKLYRVPIAKSDFEAPTALSVNDSVTVLPSGPDGKAVRAGWVRVETSQGEFWMPAAALLAKAVSPISPTSPSQTGGQQPVDVKSCSLRRLVTALRGNRLDRIVSGMKIIPYTTGGFWRMDLSQGQKATPADKTKTYVACEVYAVNGRAAVVGAAAAWRNHNGVDYTKALGIRLLEVRREDDGQRTRYVPVEDYGGFVQTWMVTSQGVYPRVELGQELGEDWSLSK